ncbi:LysR family transcriptional regulator [Butyricicoccus sp. 1XD8-22]|nr:LysR family transcriptional regulator [Butyricicoccus sp. 1XD8-22]
MGVKLFNRNKRVVELTEAGKYFLEKAKEIVLKLETVYEETKQIENGVFGKLSIGFTGSVTYDLLPTMIQSYQKAHPKIKIILTQMSSAGQVKALENNEIDIGMLVPPVESTLLDLKTLRSEPFIIAIPRSHPLATLNEPVSLLNFKNEPFIFTDRDVGHGYYDAIISLFYEVGFSPIKSQQANELQTIVSLVASGVGNAVLPSSIRNYINNKVTYLTLTEQNTSCTSSMAWRKDNDSATLKSFIEHVEQQNLCLS